MLLLWLWFAWKFVPLWYQQQLGIKPIVSVICCDLLENSYLCGISNNVASLMELQVEVVICLKIRTFVVSATTCFNGMYVYFSCDLLENSYLCGISNNSAVSRMKPSCVVICLKIRTFVVSATTSLSRLDSVHMLWFAWKFVPLWYQQQLLKRRRNFVIVVICLKIRTFVVSATTISFYIIMCT